MIVLVTGSSKGIGKAIATKFAKNSYDVIINYNNDSKSANELAASLKEEYGVNTYVIKCDVSNEEEVMNMKNYIQSNIGNIDCLVNNAGIAIDEPIEVKNSDSFMKTISVNLLGPFLVTKYIGEIISDGGNIINISSTNGIDTLYPESIDYDASKSGVISLTHNFANYYDGRIRVNSVAPGWVNTDMNKELDDDFIKEEVSKIILHRFCEPDEIADVVYAITTLGYINDTVIRVDGGTK